MCVINDLHSAGFFHFVGISVGREECGGLRNHSYLCVNSLPKHSRTYRLVAQEVTVLLPTSDVRPASDSAGQIRAGVRGAKMQPQMLNKQTFNSSGNHVSTVWFEQDPIKQTAALHKAAE